MRAIQLGKLKGRALQEALATYQQLWSQVEGVEEELHAAKTPPVTKRGNVKYDPAIIRDYVVDLPERLQTDVAGGRAFLRDTLAGIHITDDDRMPRICPVGGETLGTINAQHMQTHGLTVKETYRRYPELGFSKKARLQVQPSPEGLLRHAQVFGLVVAGGRFVLQANSSLGFRFHIGA